MIFVRIICVSDPPWAVQRFSESPGISSKNKAKLESLGVEIIAVRGTGGGADTAIVMKAAFSCDIFAKEPEKRPEVREILTCPE